MVKTEDREKSIKTLKFPPIRYKVYNTELFDILIYRFTIYVYVGKAKTFYTHTHMHIHIHTLACMHACMHLHTL